MYVSDEKYFCTGRRRLIIWDFVYSNECVHMLFRLLNLLSVHDYTVGERCARVPGRQAVECNQGGGGGR